ncbi:MAG TPA: flagellar basal-body MS-ring/collar protein FliF [Capsulimonadaceae bacterium]|jgi:flagellar M-ring protein FliF
MNNVLEQLKTWWEGATVPTRIVGIGLVGVLIASFVVAGLLASSPNYQDLFTDLSPEDAAAITQKLDEEHVKYQMVDSQHTIRVPAAEKDHLRMEMVRLGLPAKAGSLMGTAWLKEIGMGTTTDVQKQYIRMALEGELSKTIGSLSEVSSAQVHISDGNDSPFITDNIPSSSSVVVNLKPGSTLSGDQVMGIANLVAKSVKGLDVKNVVVSDGTGAMLWDGGSNPTGPGGASATKIAAEHAFAEQKRKEYQGYLDMVLGPRKSIVTVTAELNYNTVHITDTKNTKGAVVTQTETSESYSGGGGNQRMGAVAGASANTPGGAPPTYPGGNGDGKGGAYSKSDDNATYTPNTTVTETSQALGNIQRLGIGVLIDSTIPVTTVSSVQTYLATVAGANGADPTRAVTVQQLPFSNAIAKAESAQQAAISSAVRNEMIAKIAAVVLVLGFLMFLFKKTTTTTMLATQQQPLVLEGGEQRQLLGNAGSYGSMGDGMMTESPLTIEDVLGEMPEVRPRRQPIAVPEIEEQQDIKLESIREMVRNHPEAVSLLVKGWISQDGSNN